MVEDHQNKSVRWTDQACDLWQQWTQAAGVNLDTRALTCSPSAKKTASCSRDWYNIPKCSVCKFIMSSAELSFHRVTSKASFFSLSPWVSDYKTFRRTEDLLNQVPAISVSSLRPMGWRHRNQSVSQRSSKSCSLPRIMVGDFKLKPLIKSPKKEFSLWPLVGVKTRAAKKSKLYLGIMFPRRILLPD